MGGLVMVEKVQHQHDQLAKRTEQIDGRLERTRLLEDEVRDISGRIMAKLEATLHDAFAKVDALGKIDAKHESRHAISWPGSPSSSALQGGPKGNWATDIQCRLNDLMRGASPERTRS